MPTMTLLEMVQDIENDMDGDEVNSIDDTTESTQIAQIIKTTFFEIVEGRTWPHLLQRAQLASFSDSTKPTHFTIPSDTQEILSIKYDKASVTDTNKKYIDVKYKEPPEFLDMVMSRNSSNSDITTVTDNSGTDIFVYNDRAPTYWTSFDDDIIIMDSHDGAVDSTLQTSKNNAYMYKSPTWTATDGAVPDLPAKAFPFFLAEAKSTCFASLRQSPHPKEEQKSRRQSRWLARTKWKTNRGIRYPHYGRK